MKAGSPTVAFRPPAQRRSAERFSATARRHRPVHHRLTGPAVALALGAAAAAAQAPDPDPQRFAEEIQAFLQWDAKNAVAGDPIVFVGSSSIRLWHTGERFPDLPIVNRGFGGAHISDVNAFITQTTLRHAPRMIVFYAGDNDIADGKSPAQVADDYRAFVAAVHAADPTTEIVYLPIKPSRARWAVWPLMRAANDTIRAYTRRHAPLHYVDVATPMLGPDSTPRPELFVEDGLHLNARGYDLWTEHLANFFLTHAP